jgi:hypothetical protein
MNERQNLFQQETVEGLFRRIDQLRPESARQWGKMDVAQMMAHCSKGLDMANGRVVLPRVFLGWTLGPMLKFIYTNDRPFGHNAPTHRQLVMADPFEFAREREHLKQKIQAFHIGGEAQCTKHAHPFFGKLTPQQWARGSYKHVDHHLRQFGV